MRIFIIGDKARYEKFDPDLPVVSECEKVYVDRGLSREKMFRACEDAEVILADAISPVDQEMIDHFKSLRMIHSEGVAFNAIDCKYAAGKGIYVCNNKGANAGAVAEQTIMLMLELLRFGICGDHAVREGRQIQMKEERMVQGITELADCTVGLIGFGDIAQETAKRLQSFGCKSYYNSRNRKSEKTEEVCKCTYLPLMELLHTCDIVSLHLAVCDDTKEIVNEEFLLNMKEHAYLINTARGELISNEAVRQALIDGRLQGAGFDTLYPEPTPASHPLVALPKEIKERVVLAPHLGGITSSSFKRMHRNMWENVIRLKEGQRPVNIVNAK